VFVRNVKNMCAREFTLELRADPFGAVIVEPSPIG
jgi:hypothetical protein